ncbi:GAF domain-containing protein [Ramlibacter sp.]
MPEDAPVRSPDPIVENACRRAEELLARGAALREVLARLTAAAEEVAGIGATASILVLDGEGLLRNGASPNLPADYLDAIDRLKPDPNLGTCAAAAATGEIVLTPDFQDDRKWAELRHLPAAIGFRGAWSMPIKDARQKVLGTFGVYYRERRVPRPDEMMAVAQLVATAARAITAASTASA